jgi:pantothenate kinase
LASLSTLASVVERVEISRPNRIIGIAGLPGAGKSTVAAQLVDLLPTAVLLPMDGFHLPQARLVELGRRDRMGAPDTFDVDGFVATLSAIRAGETIGAPSFDRGTEEAVPGAIHVSSLNVVVVEGNYLLLDTGGWERVAPLLDLTFFVDVDEGIRVRRLIERHVAFGKTRDAATAWALGPDAANARLIQATAVRADYRITLPPV